MRIKNKASAVYYLLSAGKVEDAKRQLADLEDAARGLSIDVRETILGLRMAETIEVNLLSALKEFVSQFSRLSGIPIIFRVEGAVDSVTLPLETELHLFRIVQEGLSNIRKHAVASQAWVYIRQENNTLTLEIRDDGIGFDIEAVSQRPDGCFGLRNIRERCQEIGAELVIHSAPREGTCLLIKLNYDGHEIQARRRSG